MIEAVGKTSFIAEIGTISKSQFMFLVLALGAMLLINLNMALYVSRVLFGNSMYNTGGLHRAFPP